MIFVVFKKSPELVNKREGALPMVAAVTVQGGAGFKEVTTTNKM